MDYKRVPNGLIVRGDAFDKDVQHLVDAEFGVEPGYIPKFNLIICDPPYGDITGESWDKSDYRTWMRHCDEVSAPDSTIAMWGGIGKPGNRPFLRFASEVEYQFPRWQIKNWVTWGKRRAYGVKDNYLFTREECLILTRGKPYFDIPLLETKRGYAGYNPKYPAKSEFLRRTNVWTDITELFKGKIHPCQKPDRLYEILIRAHAPVGSVVYDPCAGSLTTMRACLNTSRRFCVVEREQKYIDAALSEVT